MQLLAECVSQPQVNRAEVSEESRIDQRAISAEVNALLRVLKLRLANII
jgi:hypothetical protein